MNVVYIYIYIIYLGSTLMVSIYICIYVHIDSIQQRLVNINSIHCTCFAMASGITSYARAVI